MNVRPGCWLAIAIAVTFPSSRDAAACACCVNAGTRIDRVEALSSGLREEIARLRFADYAWLATTEAFPDDIKGIAAPQSMRYAAAWMSTPTGWTLTLTARTGSKGTLTLTLPSRIERREIHIPTRPESGTPTEEDDRIYDQQRDVHLNKEWHLVGPVRGDGLFAPGMRGASSARLILQGMGNGCAMTEDIHFWTLVVTGPSARFTLMGRILPPSTPPK